MLLYILCQLTYKDFCFPVAKEIHPTRVVYCDWKLTPISQDLPIRGPKRPLPRNKCVPRHLITFCMIATATTNNNILPGVCATFASGDHMIVCSLSNIQWLLTILTLAVISVIHSILDWRKINRLEKEVNELKTK